MLFLKAVCLATNAGISKCLEYFLEAYGNLTHLVTDFWSTVKFISLANQFMWRQTLYHLERSTFVVGDFSIWNHLRLRKFVLVFIIWNVVFQNFWNDLGLRYGVNKRFSTWRDLQFYSWLRFHLRSFQFSKILFNFFQIFKFIFIFKVRRMDKRSKPSL